MSPKPPCSVMIPGDLVAVTLLQRLEFKGRKRDA